MTTIVKYQPKLAYTTDFEKESGSLIKLKNGNKETKIRVMEKSTVEEMLYTVRAFENKAKDISLPRNKYLEKFVTCLGPLARDRWAKLEEARPTGTFEADEWELAKTEWIKVYVKDRNAKETIISAWSNTKAYLKPRKTNIEEHADRIDTLCHYIDLLPGARGKLTESERKAMLYNTFPKSWRTQFSLHRADPDKSTVLDILDYMSTIKDMSDAEHSKKEAADTKKKKLEEGKKKRDKSNGNKDCRLHPGQHLWKDCPHNKKNRGKTYNKNSGRGFQGRGFQGRGFQGRGFQGRGFQGRGFQGGRFNQNQGRSFAGRGRGNDQYFQGYVGSDSSTIATNQTAQSAWDSYHSQGQRGYTYNNQYDQGSYFSDQQWY